MDQKGLDDVKKQLKAQVELTSEAEARCRRIEFETSSKIERLTAELEESKKILAKVENALNENPYKKMVDELELKNNELEEFKLKSIDEISQLQNQITELQAGQSNQEYKIPYPVLIAELQKYVDENSELTDQMEKLKEAAVSSYTEWEEKYKQLEYEKENNEKAIAEEYTKIVAKLRAYEEGDIGSREINNDLLYELKIQNDELNGKIQKLEGDLEDQKSLFESEKMDSREKIAQMEEDYENEIKNKNELIEKIMTENEESKEELMKILKSYDDVQKTGAERVDIINVLEEKYNESEAKKVEFEKQFYKYKGDYESKAKDFERVDKLYKELKDVHEELEQQKNHLQIDFQVSTKKYESDLKRKEEELHQTKSQYFEVKSVLEKQLEEKNKEKSKYMAENQILKEKIEANKKQIDTLQDEKKELQDEVQELEEEVDNLKQDIALSKKNANTELSPDMDHRSSTGLTLADDIDGKKIELRRRSTKRSIKDEIQLMALTDQNSKVQELQEVIMKQKESHLEEIMKFKEALKEKMAEIKKLKNDLMEATAKQDTGIELNGKITLLQNEIIKIQESAKIEISCAQKEVNFLKNELFYHEKVSVEAKIALANALTEKDNIECRLFQLQKLRG